MSCFSIHNLEAYDSGTNNTLNNGDNAMEDTPSTTHSLADPSSPTVLVRSPR